MIVIGREGYLWPFALNIGATVHAIIKNSRTPFRIRIVVLSQDRCAIGQWQLQC
jgi:hypothetical protein